MSVVRVDQVGSNSLDRVNKLLAGIPGGVYKATYAALKRAGDTAKTKAGQFAAAEYTINKGTFVRNVNMKSHISSSGGSIVEMKISYASSVLPLLTFNTKFSRNGQVQTQVKRNGGASMLEHAFVASIYGPIAVYERVGIPRFPVEQKFGPSTGHMMQNDRVIEKMDETIRQTYEARVEHEILRVLNGWGGR
ncbi:hypothetical protein [Anaeromassilibacillus senegalensis]|uniref:hypothetical protein n=1 Tax=Anaeromassilibacillus senegalensis TaxID=1673717 RepID=UPI00067FB732|nr:hypothetical protein [Anaeromassilibacillus senegalensis]